MEITKLIPLFCLISLSLCVSFSQSYSNLKNQAFNSPQPSHIRNYRIHRKNLKQCFCYLQKPTGIPVTHILSSDGKNLERLVVYIYKDPTSENIKLFLPNTEKQIMIPDLAFDDGDHIEIPTSKSIHHIFNQFPDLIIKRKPNELPAQIIRPDKFNKHIKNPSVDIESPIRNIVHYEKKNYIHPKDNIFSSNAAINHDKIRSFDLDIDDNSNQNKRLIEGEADRPNSLHFISLHINRPEDQLENIQPSTNFDTVTESQPETHEISMEQPNENLNYVNSYSPKEFEIEVDINSDENGDSSVIDETIKSNLNARPSNLNNIIQIDAEQPYEQATPTPENYETRPSIFEKDNEPGTNEEQHTLPTANINPIENLPEQLNNEVENYIKPDIFIKKQFEPSQIYIKNVPQTKKYSHLWSDLPNIAIPNIYNVKNKVQKPIFVSSLIKNRSPENSIKIPLNYHKSVDDYEWTLDPVEYSNNEIVHKKHIGENDISIIAVNPETLVKKYHDYNEDDLRDTFDNWFKRQMKRVEFLNSRASMFLDIYSLKHLIEKTLHEKGMHITDEGFIIDSEGNILQTSNLGLRPILMGKSVQYENLLQGKFNTFKVPIDLPYLEAILITSINPPKILGIIPLGKTYLPKTYQRPLSLYIDDDGSPKHTCNGGCNHRDKLIVPSVNAKRTEGDFNVPGYKVMLPKLSKTGYSHRIFPFDQVNTIIDKIYKIPINEEKIVSVPEAYVVKTDPIVSTRPILKYPVTVTKVAPGFRIIGGNAATSSGTPLSNKGRSGYDSSEAISNSADSETANN